MDVQFSMRKGRLCRIKNLGGVYLPPFNFRCPDMILQKGIFCVFAVEWEPNAIRFYVDDDLDVTGSRSDLSVLAGSGYSIILSRA
jgi:hypothetical protein